MAETRARRKKVAAIAAVMLALVGVSSAEAQRPPPASRLTSVEVKTVQPAGEFKGVAYVRVSGTVRGAVDAGEDVVGLAALPENGAGAYEYASNFELIVPAQGQSGNEVIYIDAENRGSAISQGALGGFLQNHATSYGRVQWQTGISAGVPESAQGVGLVIMRDFARWLAGRTPQTQVTGEHRPTPYGKLMLGGISQSAWFVNTFVAEGFNVDPVTRRGVFDAAIAIDGVGNWLAINRIAADRGVAKPHPYIEPNGVPLQRAEMLKRPQSDPLFVDVANYSDFYRLRAGLTSHPYSGPKFRRYDFPSPHAVGTAAGGARCNGGQPISFNTLRYAPYFRALVLGMQKEIGIAAAASALPLPPSAVFELGPAPPPSEAFNPLPGVEAPVPKVDADGWPIGGVRFLEADFPHGRPIPPAVPPAVTTSISATCGNFGGWQPFTPDEMRVRYRIGEETAMGPGMDVLRSGVELVGAGFLLPEDSQAVIVPVTDRVRGR